MPPSLEGITLGDDAASVLRRFSVSPSVPAVQADSNGDLWMRSFDSNTDFAMITIYYDARVRLVAVTSAGRTDAVGDPFGVSFGDSPERVQKLRGKPDDITTDGSLVYEPDGRIQWSYGFEGEKLVMISVDDLHPQY
jgi:hypothetical protein